MLEYFQKLKVIGALVLITLTGCGNNQAINETNLVSQERTSAKNVIKIWKSACLKKSISESCTQFLESHMLEDSLADLNLPKSDLFVDFNYKPSYDLPQGYINALFCDENFCSSSIIIKNLGAIPWEHTLVVKLIVIKNTANNINSYQAQEYLRFESPLNPKVAREFNIYFEIDKSLFENFSLGSITFNTLDENLVGAIPIGNVEGLTFENQGYLGYENLLRLHTYNYDLIKGWTPR